MDHPSPLEYLRRGLLATVWVGSVSLQFATHPLLEKGLAAALVLYITISLTNTRGSNRVIALAISIATGLLLWSGAPFSGVIDSFQPTMIFAALLPTLLLVRGTARRMAAVQLTQERLADLPDRLADIGTLFGAHVFGAVLNTGAFAIMSSVISKEADEPRRLAAAAAANRGMNSAILWSPFFIGFAVAATYIPSVQLWQVLALGSVMVAMSFGLGLFMFHRPFGLAEIKQALVCLAPIAPAMAVVATLVISFGALSGLSTMGSVLIVMPVLCGLWMSRNPGAARATVFETWRGIGSMGDEMLLITSAFILGTVAEQAPVITQTVAPLLGENLPGAAAIAILPGSMVILAVLGVHPIITGIVLLGALTSLPIEVSDVALFHAMLVGWSLGAVISISSLSVVVSAMMYGIVPAQLSYGRNLRFVLIYAVLAIIFLLGVDWVLL